MTSQHQQNIYEKIGGALKSIRIEKNMTLKEVENMTSISSATISQAERGKSNPSIGWLIHYANSLEINPNEIFIRAFRDDFQNKQLEKIFERFETYLPEQKNQENNEN